MDVQRREQDLNDQLQLCRDQLEATKVLHCSSIKTMMCVCACVHVCVLCVCDFFKMEAQRSEDTTNSDKLCEHKAFSVGEVFTPTTLHSE